MKRTNQIRRFSHLGALLTAIFASVAMVATTTATAHESIIAKRPAGKAKTTLRQVSLTLNSPVRGGTLKVHGPRGKASKGRGGRDPRNYSRLRAVMKRGLVPGRYTAKATWTAADGHRQRATFRFRLVR